MYKETYSIWLQNSIHNEKVYELIKRYAKEEDKDSFFPHVTLVSHIDSEETALKILNKLLVKKSTVIFALLLSTKQALKCQSGRR